MVLSGGENIFWTRHGFMAITSNPPLAARAMAFLALTSAFEDRLIPGGFWYPNVVVVIASVPLVFFSIFEPPRYFRITTFSSECAGFLKLSTFCTNGPPTEGAKFPHHININLSSLYQIIDRYLFIHPMNHIQMLYRNRNRTKAISRNFFFPKKARIGYSRHEIKEH